MSNFITDELKRRILEEVWPGTAIPLDKGVTLACPLQRLGCQHNNGDRSPSFSLNTGGGSYRCKRSGRHGGTWRALVLEVLGEARWKELTGGNRASAGKLEDRWERLDLEERWTRDYGIRADVSQRYLRRGKWTPQEDTSESVIGLWAAGKLRGIKWRAPSEGYTWRSGSAGASKYVWTAGSKPKGFLFLGELAAVKTQDVRVVVTAGEKDALVALSHLDPGAWSPVTGVDGEATPPTQALRELCQGRRVVVAYDPDQPGRAGAWMVARALRGAAAEVLAAVLPEGVAGPEEPKWDVAALVRYRGAAALVEALERAVPVPEAWRPEHAKEEPAIAPEAPQAQGEGEGPAIRDPLDNWRLERGYIVERRAIRAGNELREQLELKFRGSIQVTRVEVTRQEDPEAHGGWSEDRRVEYALQLPGGPVVRRTLPAGARALGQLLDQEYAAANRCHRLGDDRRLLQFVERSAAEAERVELVRAVGPHRQLGGWVGTPGLIVRNGRVEPTEYSVTAPGELQDLARYRLLDLPKEELRDVGSWLVSDLLRIDHAQGGYVLPVLGAVVAAPLWSYLPALASWQRYALLAQGSSGIGKTWLVRAILSLWGDFLADPEGLTTWLSSATAIEDLLHQVVGAPVLVADFKRANMDANAWKSAQALIQAYADRSSRGRAEASGKGRRRRPPRCQLLIDGEDLPSGQQSTLGRLVILEVTAKADPRCPEGTRCATTEGLDLARLARLPGVTAAWIAWVQRERATLATQLYRTVASLEQDLQDAAATTNRSRVVRNYAVQLTALAGFATFLEDELGVRGAYQAIQPRAVEVHRALAIRQLSLVGEEGAAELFLCELGQLLQAGIATIRPHHEHSGPNPFKGGESSGAVCVGTYHEGHARLLPDVAVALVQAHRGKGGGERIEFSRRAIGQQLAEMGIESVTAWGGQKMTRVWRVPLERLSAEGEGPLFEGVEGAESETPKTSDEEH